MSDKENLFNKKLDDLTVGDSIKIQLGFMALALVIPVVLIGGGAVKAMVDGWREEREVQAFTEHLAK